MSEENLFHFPFKMIPIEGLKALLFMLLPDVAGSELFSADFFWVAESLLSNSDILSLFAKTQGPGQSHEGFLRRPSSRPRQNLVREKLSR